MYIPILFFVLIHININMYILLFTTFIRTYLLFTFLLLYIANSYVKNENTLIYVNHTPLKYQRKNVKIIKI